MPDGNTKISGYQVFPRGSSSSSFFDSLGLEVEFLLDVALREIQDFSIYCSPEFAGFDLEDSTYRRRLSGCQPAQENRLAEILGLPDQFSVLSK